MQRSTEYSAVPIAVLQTEGFDPTDENVNYRFGAPNVVEQDGVGRARHMVATSKTWTETETATSYSTSR